MSELSLADGDKVLFVGNSIFRQYKWAHYMAARLQLFNPAAHIRTVCIGQGGASVDSYRDSGDDTYEFYSKWVKSLEPTHVMMEFGHNEGGASEAAYKADMQALVEDLVDGYSGAIPLYAGCNPKATSTGANILKTYDDANEDLVSDLSMGFVSKTATLAETVWENSANWTAIGGADDKHPGNGGNGALFWLCVLGFDWSLDISQCVIAANTPAVTSDTNCTISSLATNAYGGVDFTRLDDRLPWAIDEAARANTVALYPDFANAQDFSTTLTGLTAGTYDIYIGGVFVVSKTHTEMAAGWNMSDLTTGPYFDQCQEVLGCVRDIHDVNRTTLATNPLPREGVELYKSNASTRYAAGDRDLVLKAALSTSLASIASYEALLYTAKQPVARTFSFRRQGFGPPDPPAQRSRGIRRAGAGNF